MKGCIEKIFWLSRTKLNKKDLRIKAEDLLKVLNTESEFNDKDIYSLVQGMFKKTKDAKKKLALKKR